MLLAFHIFASKYQEQIPEMGEIKHSQKHAASFKKNRNFLKKHESEYPFFALIIVLHSFYKPLEMILRITFTMLKLYIGATFWIRK